MSPTMHGMPRPLGVRPGPPAHATEVRSLYVHIPFCERKCEYCDFTSVAGTRGSDAYMGALCQEVSMLGRALPGTRLDTLFIGGGTPSLVEPRDVAGLLDTVRDAFTLAPDAEVTLEANPSSTSRERAAVWRAAGVNRVSLGVQSLHPPALTFLGRVHDAARALAAVEDVRAAGIDNLNCDLIYAVPGLDDSAWQSTLDRVVAAGPDHISCYELTVEQGTPLHRSVQRGDVRPASDDTSLRQHRIALETLSAAGLGQYEVSNFATPGRRCRHNLAYWRNRHYLAAGVGAHGHLPAHAAAALGIEAAPGGVSVRYWHGRGIAAYVAAAARGMLPITGMETIDACAARSETLMLGLRLNEGLPVAASPVLEQLAAAGLITWDGASARVTRRGENVLNAVVEYLVDAEMAPLPCYA